jgi:lysophospholipase L1-like esterase
MKKSIFCLLAIFGMATLVSADFNLPSVEQESELPGEGELRRYPGYVKGWPSRRKYFFNNIQKDQKSVVFLGDSITQGWGDNFKGLFPGMKLANRGISGDTTRGMLIRLKEDVLSLNPSAIVMLMGTNDLEIQLEPEVITRNFKKLLNAIKAHNSNIPLVVCKVFPSSVSKKRPKEKIEKVNELYAAIVKNDPQVILVDTWTLYANEEGDATKAWMPDLLHLNKSGYEKWAKALTPIFATLGFVETKPDAFEVETGFKSLFNGHDLSGWGYRVTPPRKKPKKPRPNPLFFVEIKEPINFDSKKVSSDGRYEAINGRLVVKTPIEGRRIQQIWTQKEFSGDFILKLEFRATPNADSGVFIRKPQLQCRDYPLAGPYNDLKHYKEGDWNELVVTVKNNIAHATCNGELLTDSMQVPEIGPIGLEGDRGQMEYRRIRLKQL